MAMHGCHFTQHVLCIDSKASHCKMKRYDNLAKSILVFDRNCWKMIAAVKLYTFNLPQGPLIVHACCTTGTTVINCDVTKISECLLMVKSTCMVYTVV